MPRLLGDAFIVISPLTDDFGREAEAGIRRQLAGIHPEVKVGADVSAIPAAITELMSRLRQLSKGRVAFADLIDINVPQGQIVTQLLLLKRLIQHAGLSDMLGVNLNDATIREQLAKIASLSETIEVGANTGSAGQAIAGLQTQLAVLENQLSHLTANVDDTAAAVKLGELEQLAAALYDQLDHLTADIDVTSVLAKIYDVEAEIKALTADAGTVKLSADISGVLAAITEVRAALAGLKSVTENIRVVADVSSAVQELGQLAGSEKTAGAAAQAAAVQLAVLAAQAGNAGDAARLAYAAQVAESIALKQSGDGTRGLNAAIAAGIPLWTAGTGRFAALGGSVQLFGGALTSVGVPALLATAGGLHIAIDALVEFAAVIIPAAVAFAAFGAAAIPTAQAIVTQLTNIRTVSAALGTNIYPLSGAFQALAQAVQPQVYNLFGQALVVINSKIGEFAQLATQAATVIQQLGARAAAALTSGGISQFLANARTDLAQIGDIIANLFGTVGNLLHALPGYANVLLTALDGVSKALEAITASPITQWVVEVGLAFHGALLYLGLAVTAVVALGNGLVGLAAKFGLVDAGLVAFNAAQFATGIRTMLAGVIGLGAALTVTTSAEDAAAAATTIWAGALAALDAVNPLIWVGLAAAALGGLIYWLTRSTSATQAYDTAVKQALSNAPVTQLGVDLTRQMALTAGMLANAEAQLGKTQEYVSVLNVHTGVTTQQVTQAYQQQLAVISGYKGELATLQGYQANFNTLLKAAGGNLGLLTEAGITSNQVLGASKAQMAALIIEVQAAAAAFQAMALGTGRNAAAMNALNFAAGASSNALGNLDTSMAKVVQAEDQLFSTLIGGEQSFIAFAQALAQTATNARVSGASLSGLNSQSLTLASSFYTTLLPAAQKVIDALQMQAVSTATLRTAVATEGAQMLTYAGQNVAARVAIVDLINNALGPGTVSLKTLNTWVKNNSTTMQGFAAIVGQAQVKASSLAGVLLQDLTNAFRQDLLATSGADAQLKAYTNDLTHNQATTAAGQATRAALIKDLENSGLSAQQATTFVNGLSTSISNIPKNTAISLTETGTGTFSINQIQGVQGPPPGVAAPGAAAGGLIKKGTSPTADDVLIRVSKGETVVSAADSRLLAPAFRALGIPGYATGGLIGGSTVAALGTDAVQWHTNFDNAVTAAMEAAMTAAMQQAVSSATAAAIAAAAGGGGSGAVANQATIAALAAQHGWTGAQLTALLNVIARESGGSLTATNPTSGAYGIAQFIGGPSEYAVYGGNSSTVTGQVTAMLNYIAQRYGSPEAAWQHELQYGWYDNGGLLGPGATLAWNGTGRPEQVLPLNAGAYSHYPGSDQMLAELRALRAEIRNLTAVTAAVPAQTGQHVGAAVSGAAGQAAWRTRYPIGGW